MKRFKVILLSLFALGSVVFGLFIWYLAYSKTTNLSEDVRFKKYLNKPLTVKQPTALKQSVKHLNRFSDFYIKVSFEGIVENETTILKKYAVGDTISFTSAKGYFSNHVGDSYYLLGKTKLASGETIEYEYAVSFEYSPAIWETSEAFLARRKLGEDFP